MKIISADERLAEKTGAKILVIGPSGIGKTSLLRTMSVEQLASCLLVDCECGDLAIADLPIASVRPQRWQDCQNIACALGGPNTALSPISVYSEAHYQNVMQDPELARLAEFNILFVDSLTAAARLCFTWAEQQPEAVSNRGQRDLRAIYGAHGRAMVGSLNQLQHSRTRTVIFVAVLEKNVDDYNVATWQLQIEGSKTKSELPAIVDQIVSYVWCDFGDRKPIRTFVCTNPNQMGYPAKDRSGRLDQFEPPDLGALIKKLTGPGQRKPFTISTGPEAQAQEEK